MSRHPTPQRVAAKAAGARMFSTGTACQCGTDVRYTSSGACVFCSNERAKFRHAGNKELISKQAAARYQKHKQEDLLT